MENERGKFDVLIEKIEQEWRDKAMELANSMKNKRYTNVNKRTTRSNAFSQRIRVQTIRIISQSTSYRYTK